MNTTQTRPPAARPQPPSPSSTLPALPPLTRAILADWDNPAISELELAELHGLTLEALYHHSQTPAFRAALGFRRRLRDERRESYLQLAQDHAAEVLATLSKRPPDSIAAAKEIRLALKELIRLRSLNPAKPEPTAAPPAPGAGGVLPPDRPQGDPSCGADLQSAIPETPPMKSADSSPPSLSPEHADHAAPTQDPPSLTLRARQDPDPAPDPTPTPLPSGGVGAAAPTPQTPLQPIPRPNPHKPKSPRGYKSRPKPKSR